MACHVVYTLLHHVPFHVSYHVQAFGGRGRGEDVRRTLLSRRFQKIKVVPKFYTNGDRRDSLALLALCYVLRVLFFLVESTLSEFCIPHCAFRISHSAFRNSHFAFRISHFAFRIPHSAFRISHFAFRISHFPFPISHFPFPISQFALHMSPFSAHISHCCVSAGFGSNRGFCVLRPQVPPGAAIKFRIVLMEVMVSKQCFSIIYKHYSIFKLTFAHI
jgi:hypothetical protein